MNIGDFFRGVCRRLDEAWITHVSGRPVVTSEEGISFRGEYVVPDVTTALRTFGIDTPDEMDVIVPYHRTLKLLGKPPAIGTKLWINGMTWVICQRRLLDGKWSNDSRLALTVQRYEEAYSTGKSDGEPTQRTDQQGDCPSPTVATGQSTLSHDDGQRGLRSL